MQRRSLRLALRPLTAATFAALLLGLTFTVAPQPVMSTSPTVERSSLPLAKRPNIVLVVTDDQRLETLAGMPEVQRLLVRRGVRFSHASVPTAICCPSRATILTGLFSHSTGVYSNGAFSQAEYGGWSVFQQAGMEERTIAVALDGAGYETGLFGKYLNNFSDEKPSGYRPPGWDTFLAFDGPNAAYYQYRLADGTEHGVKARDYSTDVLAKRARQFVRAAPQKRPVFVMLAPYGPHRPYVPARRHTDARVEVPVVDERGAADVFAPESVGPAGPPAVTELSWQAHRQRIAEREAAAIPKGQMRTLLSVDEGVASLVRTMKRTGRAKNTLFVFMSDNGYLWGEHGLVGKDAPYAAATRVPLVLRWDGRLKGGRVDGRLAGNVDIAATLADAAGLDFETEGLSLLGGERRDGMVLEATTGNWGRPAYCGWRTKHRMFLRWADGREELYDYRTDPGERNNLAGLSAVAEVQDSMREAARAACSPEPPNFDW